MARPDGGSGASSAADPALAFLSERPALLTVCAEWSQDAFAEEGETLEEARAWFARAADPSDRSEATVVAFADGAPVAMASRVVCDLSSHAHLTPWLASVYVRPERRGRGWARRVVAAIESEAAASDVEILTLFTPFPALYEKMGWRVTEVFDRGAGDRWIMRKPLCDHAVGA